MLDMESESMGRIGLLNQLSQPVRCALLSRGRSRNYVRGETISCQGDRVKTLKIVSRGWVKIYRVSSCGDEAVLQTLGEGASFDEIAALKDGPSNAYAEALSDCTLYQFDLSAVGACASAAREVTSAVLSVAADHLDAMASQIEELKIRTGAQRLARFLLELSAESRTSADLLLPFEKKILAGMLGLKPESLSRAFNRLKPLGVCCIKNRVSIDDIAALNAFLREDAARVPVTA